MALTIEDGSIVADADTYLDAASVISFAADRGVTLDNTGGVVEHKIRQAMDYLEAQEDNMRGQRHTPASQFLSYPRRDTGQTTGLVTLPNGRTIALDEIPRELKAALCHLVMAVEAGVDLQPNTDGKTLIERTVGDLTRKWATPEQGGASGAETAVKGYEQAMRPLLKRPVGTVQFIRV